MKKIILTLLLVYSFSFVFYGQTTIGPGGITTDLQLWLKANDGLGYSDSQPVQLWANQGRGSDVTTNLSSQAPIFRDNVSRNINFNPIVDFSNTPNSPYETNYNYTPQQYLEGTDGFYTEEMYVVAYTNSTVTSSFGAMDMFCGDADATNNTDKDITGIGWGNYSIRFSNEILSYAISTTPDPNPSDVNLRGYGRSQVSTTASYNNVGIINSRNNTSGNSQELNYNANDIGNTEVGLPNFRNIDNSRFWIGRSQSYRASYDGRIAEVITYSSRKNDADLTQERNRIQSYLAIKYGITLGVNGTSQDYVDSSGALIWDVNTGVPANNVFNYNIAGIGRDDVSALNQKQSKSVNIGSIVAIGLGRVASTNTANTNSFNTDKDFLVWGSNNAAFNTSSEVAQSVNLSSSTTTFIPVSRKWKIIETQNDVPEVVVSIPTSSLTSNIPLVANEEYTLVVSDDASFGASNIIDVVPLTTNGINSEVWYDFDGTKYFTIAKSTRSVAKRRIDFTTGEFLLGDSSLELSNNFTVSAWVKNNGLGGTFISKGDGYNFKVTTANNIEMDWNGSTQLTSTNTMDNNWHHVALTFSSGTATLYLDGILDKTVSLLPNPISTTNKFSIGALYTNKNSINSFDGSIDEVRFWNEALSITEIRYIMNQEIEEFSTNVNGEVIPQSITKNDIGSRAWNTLQAYYDMNSFYGTTVEDNSNNKNWARIKYLTKDKQVVEIQTAPLPYESGANGNWDTPTTWLNNTVQYLPNIIINGTKVDWNIVQTTHDIFSGNRDITVLGLKNNAGKLTIDGTTNIATGTGTGQGLRVTHYLELDGRIDLEGESQLIQDSGSILDADSGGDLERDQQGTANSFNYNYWSSSVGPKALTGTSTRGTGLPSVNANYELSDVLKDGTNAASPGSITFLPEYWSADTGVTAPIIISSYWLYTFNGSNGAYSQWHPINELTSLMAGEGYTMKGTSGAVAITNEQNYVFKGKPNNGDITLPIVVGKDRLIGNPYASAIDADEFIKDNIQETINSKAGRNTRNIFNGALYFWDHFGEINTHILREYVGGYATYNLMGGAKAISNDYRINANNAIGTKIPTQYIPVGQGFFVIAALDATLTNTTTSIEGGDIVFKNSQRIFKTEASGNSVFMKSVQSKTENTAGKKGKNPVKNDDNLDKRAKIWLQFDSPTGYHRQLLVGVDENATNHFDLGYDAPIADIGKEDMYWTFSGSKFVIQGVNNFDKKQELPLGLVIGKAGLATIKIDTKENLGKNTSLYIKDKLTGLTYDINSKPFGINLEPGTYDDRFFLVFKGKKIKDKKDDDDDEDDEDENHNGHHHNGHHNYDKQAINNALIGNNEILVYMNNTISELQINNIPNTEIISINLFNNVGQLVNQWNTNLNNSAIYLPVNVSSGAYIVQINTKNGSDVQKVIIE